MDNEMLREMAFYPEAELDIKVAGDNSEEQIRQIESFVEEGVDVLIIAPYQAEPLTEVVNRVYRQGIPVILIDRETTSENYTTYIGADNYEIGRTACRYIADQVGSGKVIEVRMSMSITPAQDRSNGFRDALKDFPDLEIVGTVEENIEMEPVADAIRQVLRAHPEANIIYGQNDKLARSAYEVIRDLGRANDFFIVGVDGLIGKNEGIQMVENGILDASLLYPTGGSEAIRVAMTILRDLPVEKRYTLHTTVIDQLNAHIIHHQLEEVQNLQAEISEQIQLKEELQTVYNNQQVLICILIGSLLLTLLLGAWLWRLLLTKQSMNADLRQKNDKITRQKKELEEMTAIVKENTQAKVEFFTNVSHEFKTPLTLILGYVNDLLPDPQLNKDTKEGIFRIRQNARRLLQLVGQAMDFRMLESAIMKLRASEQDIVPFLANIIQAYQPMANRRNINLQIEAPAQPLLVWFDPDLLDKVIFNILSNAFKFTEDHRTIRLSIEEHKTEKQCSIQIEDQGIGMDEARLQQIFKPFFKQYENNPNGTGLGLSLSKKLMELHGGTIQVRSIKGEGSVFTMVLPLGRDHLQEEQLLRESPLGTQVFPVRLPPEEVTLDKTLPAPTAEEGPTILLIEDNEDIQYFLQKKLQASYQVLSATDGKTGRTMAYKHMPDLIICDVKLPEENGLFVLRKLKNDLRTSHIPIILLTARSELQSQIEGIKLGADSYITKPFNMEFLQAMIINLLSNRRLLREVYGQSPRYVVDEQQPGSSLDTTFLQRFMVFVEENFQRHDFQVADLCDELNLSRSQLYRKTKVLLGQSIGDYVQEIRLQKAKELLQSGQLSIAEVAYEVGYASPEYFSTVFKNRHGITPSKFSKN